MGEYDVFVDEKRIEKEQVVDAAIAGLDFLVRNQCVDECDANFGRFPFIYDCVNEKIIKLTSNWVTGTAAEALLIGYKFTGQEKYLDATANAVEYIKTLQDFSTFKKFSYGGIHETTAHSPNCHPRDALTAALAMLDWSVETDDKECYERALLFAEWFVKFAIKDDFPVCTVDFKHGIVEPYEFASCHGGSALLFYRLYVLTGEKKYKKVMQMILQFFNTYHLNMEGETATLLDRNTRNAITGTMKKTMSGGNLWEVMHMYNDDFGALANLAAYSLEKDDFYQNGAERFLRYLARKQRLDGGFGPKEFSVPSAGGTAIIEFLVSRSLGFDWIDQETIDNAVNYLLNRQFRKINSPADGAFLGVNQAYEVSNTLANMRSTSYAIMALLRYSGAIDPYYFLDINGSNRA
jgi:hypothetical protein